MDTPTAIRVAKLISFPTSFLLAGYSFSFSQNTVPLLYDRPAQVSTPLFSGVFHGGAAVVPHFSILASSTAAYLAYAEPANRRLWSVAVAAVLSTQAWTLLWMLPGIKRLIAISEAAPAVQAKVEMTLEHRQLMTAWVRQNWVRASLYFVGGAAGLWAAMGA